MKCDLHTHSVFSDGTFTPRELVKKAKENNLVIALTDHNTVDGLKEFSEAGKEFNVTTVPGIEFTTEFEGTEFHIVALFIKDESFDEIKKYVSIQQERKKQSNLILCDNLRKKGYEITLEDVIEYTGSKNINRANIASYLLQKGYISSIKKGFRTILSEKSGNYIPMKKLDSIETIKFINSIGAVSVWAHPYISTNAENVERIADIFRKAGLIGIETRYSLYDKETETMAERVAKKHSLLPSGGSDFHGINKPEIEIGTGKGNLNVPDEFYYEFKKIIMPTV